MQGIGQEAVAGVLGQGGTYGGQGVEEAFVLYPLAAQDDGGAEEDGTESDQEEHPPGEGDGPGGVRDVLASGEAFKEPGHGAVFVGRDSPGGDVRVEVAGPLIFRGGKVVDAGEGAHEEAGDAGGGDGGSDESHGEDGEEFGFCEGDGGSRTAEDAVEEDEEEVGGKQGDGEEGELHARGVDDVF